MSLLNFKNKQKSRIARTKAYFEHRHEFMNLLVIEIANHIAKAKQKKMKPSVRLNGTSDIPFERVKFDLEDWVSERIGRQGNTLFEVFHDIQFMDELCKIEAHDAEVLCLEYSSPVSVGKVGSPLRQRRYEIGF